MASLVTPGVLERSRHIQTLKKLGFTKPPTSTSSSARTRRASNASSTDRSGQASQRAHKGRPLACRGERSAYPDCWPNSALGGWGGLRRRRAPAYPVGRLVGHVRPSSPPHV